MLTAKFTSVYVPEQDISIDESLLLYKGRLFFKQYIPNKRSKFGIKSYELCESRSGYTWKYSLYTGQDRTLLVGMHGSSYCIVMKLLDGLLHLGHRLAVDNYYNSPQLCSDLFDAQTNCLGTVRPNRVGMPSDLRLKPDGQELQKGEVIYRTMDKLMALCWLDRKYVNMLSNCNDEKLAETGKKDRDGQHIVKAQVIIDYNEIMGGVDRVDQLLQYYSFLRKSIKWYKKVAFHLFDVALLNSQILWMKAHPDAKMTGLEFRMTVVEQIIHKTGADPSASCKGGRPSGSVLPTRLTARHFPSLIPPTERRHVVFRQCRLCNKGMGRRHVAGDDRRRIETKVQCTECGDIPLCSAPCFGLWHTEVDI